jgi:hypothetical protein
VRACAARRQALCYHGKLRRATTFLLWAMMVRARARRREREGGRGELHRAAHTLARLEQPGLTHPKP